MDGFCFFFFFTFLFSSRCTNCTKGVYIPKQCEKNQCATLLAPSFRDTEFVRHHIEELNLYVNVIWLGDNLKSVIDDYLLPIYESQLKDGEISKKFLVLHRTPSEIIDSNVEYEMITMPQCEDMLSSVHTNCKYELMPMLKYFSEEIPNANALHMAIKKLDFDLPGLRRVFELYDNVTRKVNNKNTVIKYSNQLKETAATSYKKIRYERYEASNKMYNEIACEWIKQSKDIYDNWFDEAYEDVEEVVHIGGIFPITAAGAAYSGKFSVDHRQSITDEPILINFCYFSGLISAVEMAERAINSNSSILPYIQINVVKADGKCRTDEVMRQFISIYSKYKNLLGILGPACSETVEPIAGQFFLLA